MSRRRRPVGNPFPFLPVPKKVEPKVVKPAVEKPAGSMIKAAPVSPSGISRIPSAESFDDRFMYMIKQEGQGVIDDKAFQIQKTKDGWRVCAMWKAEGVGEIPPFLKKMACNLDVFNDVFNIGMRVDPEVKMETLDGGLFEEERSAPDAIGKVLRNVVGAIKGKINNINIGYFDDPFYEEDSPMT